MFKFTSESVSKGHPDKVCDQISDAILDAFLTKDKDSRVACEVLAKSSLLVVAGEVRSTGTINYPEVCHQVIKDIGYYDAESGIDVDNLAIILQVNSQSEEIAKGVDEGETDAGETKELGAGDQGIMFGYACNETDELMPLSISLSHHLMQRLTYLRFNDEQGYDHLRPDAKSQVTVNYVDGKLDAIDTIVISTQHGPYARLDILEEYVIEECIKPTIPTAFQSDKIKFLVNYAGEFVFGGPQADCGLTGRKIIVDTYGGHAPHGGGAFSGKDATKIDRSGAYLARYIAKNLVAAGVCDKCVVQLSYVIGAAAPVSINVNTLGTGKQLNYEQLVREVFPLKPREIINTFELYRPIFRKTATYGHFGRSEFPWERTDLVEKIKEKLFN
ncbi:MAG: methionine adenosyltransferase [Pseudomonadota bacterium]|nr:methionine adenosyltransferase [Pseudomonadota bacterium]